MPHPSDYATQQALPASELNKIMKSVLAGGLKAGEAIDGSTTPQAVAEMIENAMWEQNTTTDGTDTRVGYSAVATKKAIKFRVANVVTANQVKLIMAKVGSPADNLVVTIETDSSGSPSGTPITNGTSNNLAGSGLKTTAEEQVFSFASAFTLAAGTTYWVVISRSGAASTTDYYFAFAHSVNFANFSGKRFDGSAWQTSIPMYFEIIPSTGSNSVALYKAMASIKQLSNLSGFIVTNAAQDSTPNYYSDGIVPGFSSLTTYKPYYLQDTAGTIGISVGTIFVLVGQSQSASTIRIKRSTKIVYGTIASYSVSLGTSQSGTLDTVLRVAFRPRQIRFKFILINSADAGRTLEGDVILGLIGNTYQVIGGWSANALVTLSDTEQWAGASNNVGGASQSITAAEVDENGVTIRFSYSTGGTFSSTFQFNSVAWSLIE